MKKGISSTIIGIILIVVGLAIILFLLMYFGKTSESQTIGIIEKLNILKGGGNI
ncbi:MAG: hypothetical protein J7K73_03705 [Nanoarchaeota archaeon]|nr:hypothetical protein [Nanoarchaeota archaeon]